MKNAILHINNSNGFMDDIWQYENDDFDINSWKEAMENFADIISEAKKYIEAVTVYLDEEDMLDKTEKEIEMSFGDDKLYQLGDAVNFFDSIGVREVTI